MNGVITAPVAPGADGWVVLGGPGMPRRVWISQIMGMPISVTLRGAGTENPGIAAAADAATQELFEQLRRVDATFSTWQPASEVSRIGRGELSIADASADVQLVGRLADEARVMTAGWFDPMLPDRDGEVRWDPTGLVKGWAVERAAGLLPPALGDWCVNAGGDVVLVPGPDPQPWLVGIEDPADRSRVLGALSLAAGGMATSGSAARGGHVIDPRTGLAATSLGSVTVHGPSLMWADVWATAAYAAGPEAPAVLAAADGYQFAVVSREGTVTTVS